MYTYPGAAFAQACLEEENVRIENGACRKRVYMNSSKSIFLLHAACPKKAVFKYQHLRRLKLERHCVNALTLNWLFSAQLQRLEC